jgi:hypothetical protein
MNTQINLFLVVLSLTFPLLLAAQRDTIAPPADDPGSLLEDVFQDSETDIDFDFNTLYENLQVYRENPLDLNKTDAYELNDLGLLTEIQINRLLDYRDQAGDFIAIYELQAIPGFDLALIKRLLPFVTVNSSLDDFQLPIHEMFYKGKNEIYMRWQRNLQLQKGFRPSEDPNASRYLGDPNKYYFRFKHSYENRFSYGITAEKDAGEEFFTGSNPNGFDFYSAHLWLRNYNKHIKAVAIGDYTARFGQGLILYGGFGYSKSSITMGIKRSGRTLSPFTSVNETSFFRGVGTTVAFDNIEVTVFGSQRNRDGNLVSTVLDTLEQALTPTLNLSSILNSGLHRTPNEIADKNAFTQQTAGASVKYTGNNWSIGLNGVYDRFNISIFPNPRPYNRFFFSGNELFNGSIDYNFRFQNMNLFGETAIASNGSMATLNGLLIGLDRNMDIALLQRSFDRDFQTLNGNPFAETTGVRNEQGFYIGTEIRPYSRWRINAYFDIYEHPWLRFRTDAPSQGHDWLARITYFEKRKLEVYLQVRSETKLFNASDNETKTDFLAKNQLFTSRLQFSYKVNKALELRTRLNAGFFRQYAPGQELQTGFVVTQDILYRPMTFPLSFTTRFALFDTDSYAIRFYNFENDLLYSFSIPAYFDQGSRFYINLRYKGIRNLTLEARYARTVFSNLTSILGNTQSDLFFIGSGLEEIQGNRDSEVKFQLKYQF